MAIREQAGDWSRPEAEEDAPRQTGREFFMICSLTHIHTHATDIALPACLLACHTNQVNTSPSPCFCQPALLDGSLPVSARLLPLSLNLFLSLSVKHPPTHTPSLALSLSLSTTLLPTQGIS